jgi:uncharacterized membrane protein YfcA
MLIYLVIGIFSGLLAGSLGLGGGVIIVPALAVVFAHYNLMPHDVVMRMAIGTSLATLVITLLASLRVYMYRGSVRWDVVRQLLPGLLPGILAGALLAQYLPSNYLRIFFGLFLLVIAARLFFTDTVSENNQDHPLPPRFILVSVTGLIGILCGVLGIGGGVMMVPFLLRCRLGLREATGTSVFCGVCIGIVASISFMVLGQTSINSVPWSTGFIYWPAFLGISITSVLTTPLGVAISYKLSDKVLKRTLAIFLVLVAIDMMR